MRASIISRRRDSILSDHHVVPDPSHTSGGKTSRLVNVADFNSFLRASKKHGQALCQSDGFPAGGLGRRVWMFVSARFAERNSAISLSASDIAPIPCRRDERVPRGH